MHVRIILATGVAVLATAALTDAAVDRNRGAQTSGPTAADAPAPTPPTVKASFTTLTAAEREANRDSQRERFPLSDPSPYFASLRRAARSEDRLPPDATIGTPIGGPTADGARLLRQDASGTVRAIPTDRELCVSTTYSRGRSAGATDTCVPTAEAAKRGAWTVTQCSSDEHPQRRFIAGAAPDGVDIVRVSRRGVEIARVEVADNGFSIEADEPIDAIELGVRRSAESVTLPPVAC
jgi:hypothetical protein